MSPAKKIETPEEAPAPDSPEAIEERIEETREELADTVEALAAKTDFKARASEKAEELKAQAQTQAQDNGPLIAGAVAALLLVSVLIRRVRS